jgi:KDO2-lipid IV(A) lauroyltransferase
LLRFHTSIFFFTFAAMKFVSLLLRGLLFCVGVLPTCCLCLLSDALALLAGGLFGYRRKVVMSNLRKAFPDKDARELRRIARGTYRNFFDLTLSLFRIRYASDRRVRRSVVLPNIELLDQLYQQGKSGVVLAGHYACWEYVTVASKCTSHQVVAAYQPMTFEPLEAIVSEARGRYGALMAPLKEVFRVLLSHQSQGKLTLTFMVSDQSPHVGSCSHWVQLLGQQTPVLIGPERIAQKLDCAVLYLRVYVRRRFRYEYELVMLSPSAASEAPMAITTRFYAELEKDIIRDPQCWMWTHRRWKHQHLFGIGK